MSDGPRHPRRRFLLAGSGAVLAAAAPSCTRSCTRAPEARLPPAVRLAWMRIGPGGGGATYLPTVSPVDPERAAVACDMTGAYVTVDGGASWRLVNLHARPRLFAWDTRSRDTLYAASIGLFCTRDAGASWELVVPPAARVRAVAMHGDSADEGLVADGDAGAVSAIALDPERDGVLYVALARRVLVSRDGGRAFDPLFDLPRAAVRLAIDPSSPAGDRTIVAVLDDASIAVRAAGSMRIHAAPARAFHDVAIAFPRGAPPRIYACALDDGVLVSDDGGATYRGAPLVAASRAEVRAIAACASAPDVVYASYAKLAIEGATWFGVARSRNAGRTWDLVWREADRASPSIDDGWLSARFGPEWGENPLGLAVAPGDPNAVWATDTGRVLRSRDGGATFRAAYTKRSPSGGWTTTGIDVLTVHDLAFDPSAPKHVLAALTDVGLFASDDGGESWASATRFGVPARWLNTTYAIAFDPSTPGRLFAAMSDVHDLPRLKMWRAVRPSTFVGGVCESRDAGRSFRPLDALPSCAATHVIAGPHGLLLVAGFGRGVFVSRSSGARFDDASLGLPDEPLVYRLAHDARGAVWAVVVRRAPTDRRDAPEAGGLFRAALPGARFERIALPDAVTSPNGIAIDPRDPSRILVAAWAHDGASGPEGGGFFASRDAGRTWMRARCPEQHAFDVTIDPRIPGRVYGAGFSSRVWRSDDGGATFEPIAGFDFKWSHRVVLDPIDPSVIYVATFGGGIWRGPADGCEPSCRVRIL